jgi:hypothetical protein
MKLRAVSTGCERGSCSLCSGEEDMKHIIKIFKNRKCREELLCSKLLNMNKVLT